MIDFFQENLPKGYKVEIRRFGTFYVKTLKATVKTIPVKENRYYHPKEKKKGKYKRTQNCKIYSINYFTRICKYKKSR